ncbi:hypothetical protein XA68_16005 [Ophiocordyceps unilateralis]|uniref:Uncharacterized protein n=1 Tax=Ophiocordyceps unilateralis TaxID=268505 RepID=A0A2A9PLU4_OPHUN|nr:hypothetical protein XA68_16005 [Ophiocordyceps unilateralis]
MPDSEATPERTSSFRRMLEMERAYMIERLQAKKSPEGSIPNDLQPSSPLSQAENIIRRASTVDGDLKPPKSSLSVNTKLPVPRLPGESLGLDDATTAVASPAVGTPVENASPQSVARRGSTKETDDRSICVSPSWESHGRRRKEKKMMERKEKEEAAKAAATAKTRKSRLSKLPPPASSTEALRKAETGPDPTHAGRGRVKDRSKSAAAGPAGRDATQRKPRSRSSSFASLIRAPLSFRRTSIDKAPVEPEFVGGIKLELERHLANDKLLEQQLRDETVVHPALRQNRASGDRWPAPLQSHPPMAAMPRETSRAYPPITRQERTYRGRSLAAPPTPITAPTTPDTGKLDQWRARVGIAPSPQPLTPSTEQDMPLRDPDDDSDAAVGRGSYHEDDIFDDDDDISPAQSRHRAASTGTSRRKPAGLSIFPPSAQRSRNISGDAGDRSRRQSSDGHGGYRTAPSTPPEPPRRSPKRSPRANLDHVLPPLPYQIVDDDASAAPTLSPAEVSPATVTPRTAKRMVVKPATQINHVVSRHGARRKSSKHKDRQSDESGSDEFHSPSVPSTPATSRSESDKALPDRPSTKSKHMSTESSAKHLSTDSSMTDGSVVQPATHDRGIHEIQAAADKVLASYREATSGSRTPRHHQRRESEPAVRSFLPVPVQQPLQLREKPGRASVATTTPASQPHRVQPRDPSPATYLEEARHVPLGGVPARVAKPRLGPPASFTLPGDEVALTRPSLSQQEREPIAKVFVECCYCKFYHDMPSNLYEAMANPEAALSGRDTMEHEMSTRCCAGLAAMVFVTERLH